LPDVVDLARHGVALAEDAQIVHDAVFVDEGVAAAADPRFADDDPALVDSARLGVGAAGEGAEVGERVPGLGVCGDG
jgi:hypothetical protein